MEERTVVAIDPGLTGAIAFIHLSSPDKVLAHDMPVVDGEVNPVELREMLMSHTIVQGVIERVNPMPRDGVRQAWRFASAYTTARVVFQMLNIPTMLVTPQIWKKSYSVKGGPEGKEQCRALAIRTFPVSASQFSRVKDQGRAEAALLALYAIKSITPKI